MTRQLQLAMRAYADCKFIAQLLCNFQAQDPKKRFLFTIQHCIFRCDNQKWWLGCCLKIFCHQIKFFFCILVQTFNERSDQFGETFALCCMPFFNNPDEEIITLPFLCKFLIWKTCFFTLSSCALFSLACNFEHLRNDPNLYWSKITVHKPRKYIEPNGLEIISKKIIMSTSQYLVGSCNVWAISRWAHAIFLLKTRTSHFLIRVLHARGEKKQSRSNPTLR
jgi:hypothetical protein